MRRYSLIFAFVSSLVLGCTPTYVIQDLGTLGGVFSAATDINDNGHIVGYTETEDGSVHAFLLSGDGMMDLGNLGGDDSRAYGINAHDEIVGTSQSADGLPHPFLWRDGVMIDLLPEPIDECHFGNAWAINNSGWIVGDICELAVVWRSVERPESILNLSGERYQPSVARDINDADQITGELLPLGDTFMYESGTLSILASHDTSGYAINNHAQVAGYKPAGGGYNHAYMFAADRQVDLGTLGGGSSYAYGINDDGLIVGSSEKEDESQVPFVYDLSLNTMKELMSLGSGEAKAVNANGIIVGVAKNSLGNDRAVKWTVRRFGSDRMP